MLHPRELLTEGYQKVCRGRSISEPGPVLTKCLRLPQPQFHGSAFKVALMDQWLVLVSGSKLVDEVIKHAEEQLSFIEGVEDVRFRWI